MGENVAGLAVWDLRVADLKSSEEKFSQPVAVSSYFTFLKPGRQKGASDNWTLSNMPDAL
jgi:hypothetical protein